MRIGNRGSPVSTGGKRNWGAERRLEFLEFQLYWEGAINRRDLTDRFGISTPQASNDLSYYRELAPDNIEYDASAKRYVATGRFRPIFLNPSPDRYLTQIKGISLGILRTGDTSISSPPSLGVLPLPVRRLDPEVLRELLKAIRKERSIEIHHQSLSREHPELFWRRITPHALAYDGFRWHVRAFCHVHRIFKDLVIGRILATRAIEPPGARAADDWRWQQTIEVVLAPNPKLAKGQQRAIAVDFGMTAGTIAVPLRLALLPYFDRQVRSGFGMETDIAPASPVIVVNTAEYDEALRLSRPTEEGPVRRRTKAMAALNRPSP